MKSTARSSTKSKPNLAMCSSDAFIEGLLEMKAPLRPNWLDGISAEAKEAVMKAREMYRNGEIVVPISHVYEHAVRSFGIKITDQTFRRFFTEKRK